MGCCGWPGGGGGSGPSGSGTANFVPLWTAPTVLGDSVLRQAVVSGADIGVGLGGVPTTYDFCIPRSRNGALGIKVDNQSAGASATSVLSLDTQLTGVPHIEFNNTGGGPFSIARVPASKSALAVAGLSVLWTPGAFTDPGRVFTITQSTRDFAFGPLDEVGVPAVNFHFGRNVAGTDTGLRVRNASNTLNASATISAATVGNAGTAADARFQAIGLTHTWTWGQDVSASNFWVLSDGSALGTNDCLSVELGTASTSRLRVLRGDLIVERSEGGGIVQSRTRNTSSNPSSSACMLAQVSDPAAGDAYSNYQLNGVADWSIGLRNSIANDPLLICAASGLGSNEAVRIDHASTGAFTVREGLILLGRANTAVQIQLAGFYAVAPADAAADHSLAYVFDDGLAAWLSLNYNDAGTQRRAQISLGGGILGAEWTTLNNAGSPYTLTEMTMGNYAVDLSAGDVDVNLPNISSATHKRVLNFKVVEVGGGALNVAANAGDGIDEVASVTTGVLYDNLQLTCDANSNQWWLT